MRGPGERAGEVVRDSSVSGFLRVRELTRRRWPRLPLETTRLTESQGLAHLRLGPCWIWGLRPWWPGGSGPQWMGALFPALGKTKSRSGTKTKAKETWKHLTALIHHGPSFFLCSHYICL